MFKENVLSGLCWRLLISRIVWAKNPRDPGEVAPLNVLFLNVVVDRGSYTGGLWHGSRAKKITNHGSRMMESSFSRIRKISK